MLAINVETEITIQALMYVPSIRAKPNRAPEKNPKIQPTIDLIIFLLCSFKANFSYTANHTDRMFQTKVQTF